MSTIPTKIPIINFEPFIKGDITQQQAIANQIYQACQEIGFMYLKNPGISVTLLDQFFSRTKQFFDLPLAVKNQLAWSDEISNR